MTLEFKPPVMADFWTGYTDWAAHVSTLAGATGPRWRPVFVQSVDPAISTADFFKKAKADKGIRFNPIEETCNGPEMRPAGWPAEATFYMAEGDIAPRDWFTPVHYGPATEVPGTGAGRDLSPAPAKRGARKGKALGVIDDGIAFLNDRFRVGSKTRVDGIWIQTPVTGNLDLGRVLLAPEINGMLSHLPQMREEVLYRQLDQEVLPNVALARTVEQSASHGTHVMDLAGGAPSGGTLDPADKLVRDARLYAVQLSPAAVDDTSGIRMEGPVIQGLRWMILAAQRARLKTLVVNMSLGVTAGAKNGTRFLEQQMQREAEKAAKLGLAVELVLPYGNDYDTHQVSRLAPAKGKPDSMGVWLQRDDKTPSFVEIRDITRGTGLAKTKIQLTDPSGNRTASIAVPQGAYAPIVKNGVEIGRLYHVPERRLTPDRHATRSFLMLAFAPSALMNHQRPADPFPLAQGGRWTISVAQSGAEPGDISVQIQRDNVAVGYTTVGRQAVLDDPRSYGWSTLHRDYTGLPDTGPIRHDGTNNAFATGQGAEVHAIGAAHLRVGTLVASDYTSEGANWSGGDPDAAAVVDTSDAFQGYPGSGNTSWSTVRYFGSSVGAARYSRYLIADQSLPTQKPKPTLRSRLGSEVVM